MTHEELVQAALDARAAQGLPPGIDDPDVLAFIAELLAQRTEAAA